MHGWHKINLQTYSIMVPANTCLPPKNKKTPNLNENKLGNRDSGREERI